VDRRAKRRNEFISYLKRNPFVYWICEISDKYDIIFAIQARNIIEFDNLFKDVIDKYGSHIRDYTISIRTQVNHFRRNYLTDKPLPGVDIYFGKYIPREIQLNYDERNILDIILEDALISIDNLSSITNKQTSYIKRLIKLLEERGIILGYHALVCPEKYGYKTYQLLIKVKEITKNKLNNLYDYCENNPYITVFVQCIGRWNYEITCEVKNKRDLLELVKGLRSRFDFISEINQIPTKNYYVKYNLGSFSISKIGELTIKQIEDEDLFFFREIFRRYYTTKKDFEFCNGYIMQATRNLPMVAYLDSDIIFFSKKGKDKDSNYVIVTGIGNNLTNSLSYLSKYLYKKSKKPIIIKNVSEEMGNELNKIGFRDYRRDEFWDTRAKYDDNTFPQIIIRNKDLLNMKGSEYKKLREEISLFAHPLNTVDI
jgi:DNA-binding Lrp family transcriptional regulator